MSSSIKGAAEEISMDAGVAAVLLELDDIFTLNVNKDIICPPVLFVCSLKCPNPCTYTFNYLYG